MSVTKDEMILAASEKTSRAIEASLCDGTLIRLRTEGSFIGNEYKMSTHLVFTKEIGRDAPFEVK